MSEIASTPKPETEPGIRVIYDGECPFCSRYVSMMRLRDSVGRVDLIDAREPSSVVDDIRNRGFDLNEGMVAIIDGKYYHGAECVHVLGLLTTPSGLFNRLNAWVFTSEQRSRVLYPMLRAGRNTVLRILGRSKLP
ncbi:MAG: DCC1-like thiol-disulfide oxidoreductase family protein [Pseudomonadota bacterium]